MLRQSLLAASVGVIISLMLGCASTKPPLEQPVTGPNPTNLTAAPRDKAIDLRWDTNRGPKVLISGYNIYVAAGDSEFAKQNEQPYPGDSYPETAFETYPLEGLQNGVVYRVHVTTVFPGNGESKPTNTVASIPRPSGRVLLAESFSGANEGFSFTLNKHVPTDDVDNDIYLAVINGHLNLASPNRIDYVLRTTTFYNLGSATSIDSIVVPTQPSDPVRLLAISEREAVLFQDADSCYGLIYVRSIKGGEKRVIEFDYIYQTKPDTLVFD